MKLRARVVETRDATPDITGRRGITFGLDRQIADDADALAGRDMFQRYPGGTYNVDLADRGTVQLRNRSASPAKKDVGYCCPLVVISGEVHVQHSLPRGARLYPVEIADGHDDLQVGQADTISVAFVDVP